MAGAIRRGGSPLGDLAASAAAEGIAPVSSAFHITATTTRFSPGRDRTAPGGALDYIVRGKMIGGFALVAYPAQYGNSGVMTFLVNHQGTIYEKDLGEQTAIAPGMTAFNPDGTWRVSEADQASSAAK